MVTLSSKLHSANGSVEKKEHRQELLRVTQRLTGFNGWGGGGFGKIA